MGGGCGISIAQALEGHSDWLIGRDDQVFVESGSSISLRFEVSIPLTVLGALIDFRTKWPGYNPWSRQVSFSKS